MAMLVRQSWVMPPNFAQGCISCMLWAHHIPVLRAHLRHRPYRLRQQVTYSPLETGFQFGYVNECVAVDDIIYLSHWLGLALGGMGLPGFSVWVTLGCA